jgi:hypothetical protein
MLLPAPLPPFAVVSHEIKTLRSPLWCSTVPMHDLRISVPLPVATTTPLQTYRYSPVIALTSTELPGFVSSCRQKL